MPAGARRCAAGRISWCTWPQSTAFTLLWLSMTREERVGILHHLLVEPVAAHGHRLVVQADQGGKARSGGVGQ